MRSACEELGLPAPELEETLDPGETTLTIMLPEAGAKRDGAAPFAYAVAPLGPAAREREILLALGEKGSITRRDVEELLGVSKATANNLLAGLVKGGRIARRGKGPSTHYLPAR